MSHLVLKYLFNNYQCDMLNTLGEISFQKLKFTKYVYMAG